MSTPEKDPAEILHEAANSAQADQAKGHTKDLLGTIKAKVGGVIGDSELEAEGHLQKAEGKKDILKGEIKEKIETVVDTIAAGIDVIKDKIAEHRAK